MHRYKKAFLAAQAVWYCAAKLCGKVRNKLFLCLTFPCYAIEPGGLPDPLGSMVLLLLDLPAHLVIGLEVGREDCHQVGKRAGGRELALYWVDFHWFWTSLIFGS